MLRFDAGGRTRSSIVEDCGRPKADEPVAEVLASVWEPRREMSSLEDVAVDDIFKGLRPSTAAAVVRLEYPLLDPLNFTGNMRRTSSAGFSTVPRTGISDPRFDRIPPGVPSVSPTSSGVFPKLNVGTSNPAEVGCARDVSGPWRTAPSRPYGPPTPTAPREVRGAEAGLCALLCALLCGASGSTPLVVTRGTLPWTEALPPAALLDTPLETVDSVFFLSGKAGFFVSMPRRIQAGI